MRPTCHTWNGSTLKIFVPCYRVIRCIVLCILHILGFFSHILGFSIPSIIPAKNIFTCTSLRSWFVIRFVCFAFQGLLLCDRPVSGNNGLVKFALQIFKIFLILVTCKNKATSASFL